MNDCGVSYAFLFFVIFNVILNCSIELNNIEDGISDGRSMPEQNCPRVIIQSEGKPG